MSYGRHSGPAACDAKVAAVLLLLFPTEHGWMIPLTLRQPHLSVHAGQVSLPGGSMEAGESTWDTARRETQEELGWDPRLAQLVGPLSPLYVFNSNYLVHPWVAYTTKRPHFIPNEREVARVIEFPVQPMPSRNASQRMTIERGKLHFSAPYWECGPLRIWGATYIILSELAAVLNCLDLEGTSREQQHAV